MSEILTDLTLFQKVFFVLSASSTIILIIQTIIALVGLAGSNDAEFGESHIIGDSGDAGVDLDSNMDGEVGFDSVDSADSGGGLDMDGHTADSHGHAHSFDATGLRLFTVRGIMAFLMVGSWVGFILSRAGIHEIIATFCAFVCGMVTLFFMAKIMQVLMNLQADGTTRIKNALGQVGQVYIRIPGEEKGKGKVNVTVQEKLCEFDAVTEKNETIKTGEMVYVTDIRAGNVLVVEKVEDEK